MLTDKYVHSQGGDIQGSPGRNRGRGNYKYLSG